MRRRYEQKPHTLCLWNRLVLGIGYIALLYGLGRGVIYLLVLLNGAVK